MHVTDLPIDPMNAA